MNRGDEMPVNQHGGNTSQRHGTDFENLIKTTWMFDGACNAHRSGVAINDIERKFDRRFRLKTSVKAVSSSGWIGLADAVRFYEINIQHRFIIGEWVQVSDKRKEFVRIHEFILPKAILDKIRGDITRAEVLSFHHRIAEKPYGEAGAAAARAERDLIKEEIKGRHHPALRFDFKIDQYKQRRLQLCLSLKGLIKLTEGREIYVSAGDSQPIHVIHSESFCQYPLPIAILSPQRTIIRNQKTDSNPTLETLFECDVSPSPLKATASTRMPTRRDDRMDTDLQKELFGVKT